MVSKSGWQIADQNIEYKKARATAATAAASASINLKAKFSENGPPTDGSHNQTKGPRTKMRLPRPKQEP